jgi:hypothetical protein
MSNWQTLNPPSNVIHFSNRSPQQVSELLAWCWVVSLERFVLIDDTSVRRTETQFNDLYQEAVPARPTNGGRRTYTPSMYVREDHRDFRVVDHIDMVPSSAERIVTDRHGLKVLNLYRPAPSPEPTTASQDIVLDHLRWLLNGDEAALQHLLRWMAHVVFLPNRRIHHGIVISGKQGTGKSLIGRIVSYLLGSATRSVSPATLKGSFHDWMIGTRLVLVEELKEMENHSVYNRIKTFFTDDTLHINPKGLPSYDIANHLHFMMFTNHPYPMKLEEGDRRIFYVHSNVSKRDDEHYEDLHRAIFADGGIDGFHVYLRDTVLPNVPANFAHLPPPRTADHAAWIEASRNPIETFIQEQREAAANDPAGSSLFAPRTIFLWSDLRDALKQEYGHILRATTDTASVLKRVGLCQGRHTVDGRKLTYGWFEDFDEEVASIFKDTSSVGRERLRQHLCERLCEFAIS